MSSCLLVLNLIEMVFISWEASAAVRKVLGRHGLNTQGAPAGWKEVYRVFKECKVKHFRSALLNNAERWTVQFVEDEGAIVFFKNAHGLAAARSSFPESVDSGVEVDK
jgi:omega-6 fatty acid desaturase (delta-12 desaturase)